MNWAGKQHPVETIVEWVAPIPLALSAGWAALAHGLALIPAAAASIGALAFGFAAIRSVGEKASLPVPVFEPAAFDPEETGLGELLLEAKDELLELEDRLVEVEPDSRVVRLFDRPEPTPGELVDRICHFLGGEGRPVMATTVGPEPAEPIDASAALHAALANIRASLR